jgi:uncharacterized protein (UPF0332 family)
MSASGPSLDALSWTTALDFLREAEAVTADIMPRMATHAAYYAMFHAARAVLVQVDGLGAPTKHHAVVGRFGQLAKLANDAQLMAAGRLINGAQNDRLRSDYNTGRTPLPSDAARAVQDARTFLDICARHYGLPAP